MDTPPPDSLVPLLRSPRKKYHRPSYTPATEKARWDRASTETVIKCFYDVVVDGRIHRSTLDVEGWANAVAKFNALTKRNYTQSQLRNKWNQLKYEWSLFVLLLSKCPGLDWDCQKNTIKASDSWWNQAAKEYGKEVLKFREEGPLLKGHQRVIFSASIATGKIGRMLDTQDTDDAAREDEQVGNIENPEQSSSPAHDHDPAPMEMPSNLALSTQIQHKRAASQSAAPYQKGMRLKVAATEEKINTIMERIEWGLSGTSAAKKTLAIHKAEREYILKALNLLYSLPNVSQGERLFTFAATFLTNFKMALVFTTLPNDTVRRKWLEDEFEEKQILLPCGSPDALRGKVQRTS